MIFKSFIHAEIKPPRETVGPKFKFLINDTVTKENETFFHKEFFPKDSKQKKKILKKQMKMKINGKELGFGNFFFKEYIEYIR